MNEGATHPLEGDFYFHIFDNDTLYIGKYWLDPKVRDNKSGPGKRTLATLAGIQRLEAPAEPHGGWWLEK